MAISFVRKARYDMNDLLEIMRLLRSPDGCPWDREQTHRSLRTNLVEEAYEAVEAIDRDDADGLREELGDVLLQVVLHACIAQEESAFSYGDVVDGLARKLVERHPHVFGDVVADSAEGALDSWNAAKRREKGKTQAGLLDGVPHALPALMRADKVMSRAKRVGLNVAADADGIRERIAALAQQKPDSETVGELLFLTTALARSVRADAEEALALSTNRFIDRFAAAEAQLTADGRDVSGLTAAEWQKALEK